MRNRLPARQDVVLVYAVIASIVFGWSVIAFLWRVPSWLLFLQPDEIFTILAYGFSVNLLESLGFLGFLLLLSWLLPSGLLKENFAVRGGFVSLTILGSLIGYLSLYFRSDPGFIAFLPVWIIITLLAAILLCVVSARVAFLRTAILWLSDRLSVFLYLILPLAFISLGWVILRGSILIMLNRRDFLKIASVLSAGTVLRKASRVLGVAPLFQDAKPNILIFVLDAMSARHLSLYGYQRNTTPNLEEFAGRSFVYHSHFSAGNFTSPGTASILTGLHPWTHRAFNIRGLVKRNIVDHNVFNLIGNEYTRVGFTQNKLADIFLDQFNDQLDVHLPSDSFSFDVRPLIQAQDIPNDRTLAYFAFENYLGMNGDYRSIPGSLAMGSADLIHNLVSKEPGPSEDYPFLGYPNNFAFYYRNEDLFRGMAEKLKDLNGHANPWLAYFHVWSPHSPYRPRKEFTNIFNDDLHVPFRPLHRLSGNKYSPKELLEFRLRYDQYIANVDAEFGNMMRELERAGTLDNTYVIVTSDHGELFERGEWGHVTPLLYNAVTHVPLLISTPGQRERQDVQSATSSVDLLPTILKMVNRPIPDWAEGTLLPGFTETDAPSSIHSMVAKNNSAFKKIDEATFSLIKWPYELIYYYGYSNYPNSFELYNLTEDPYEQKNSDREE